MTAETGRVVQVDAQCGVACVRLDSGESLSIHAAGVYGGRRPLAVGDRLTIEVDRATPDGPRALAARLCADGDGRAQEPRR